MLNKLSIKRSLRKSYLFFKYFISFCFFTVSFIIFTPFLLMQIISIRKNQGQWKKLKLIRFIEGGNLEAIYKKYGNFDNYFQHIVPGTLDLVIGSLFETRNNFSIQLRKDYILMESPRFNWLYGFSVVRWYQRHLSVISKHKITLLHSNSPYFLGFLAILLSKLTNLPICISIHSDYPDYEKLNPGTIPRTLDSLTLSLALEKWNYTQVNMVLPIRETLKTKLQIRNPTIKNLQVFPHAVDFKQITANSASAFSNSLQKIAPQKIISAACRMENENFCHDLIDIAELALIKQKDLVFIFAGDGSQYQSLVEKVKHRDLSNFIKFPGYLSGIEVASLRKFSSVNLCLRGGFSLLEALVSGAPVISYDTDWHSEVIADGKTGILVRRNDTATAAKEILFLLDHPNEAKQLANLAKITIIDKYSVPHTNAIKSKIYHELWNCSKGIRKYCQT